MRISYRIVSSLILPGMLLSACGDDEVDTSPNDDTPEQPANIVATAQAAGLTTLLSAAGSAGLAQTLENDGPFTVFAPTDAAFAALGDAVPSDAGLLANVLLHHVVTGEQMSGDVLGAARFTTLAGTEIAVDAAGGTIGGAKLSSTLDVEASNGVVHVLDDVMVPPSIPEAVAATDDLSTLLTAVGAASPATQDALGSGPITVFAPVNSAFEGIDLGSLDQATIDAILTYHVVGSQVLSSDLSDGMMVETAGGQSFTVNVAGDSVTLTDAMGNTIDVIGTDLRLLNGTVHLIDGVLMPETDAEQPEDIVATAEAAGLTSLLSAATTAQLAETLQTIEDVTVFAPTDAAFAALGDAAPTDPGLLANVLLHHVVAGRQASSDVLAAGSFPTLANTVIEVDAQAGTIGGAGLSATLDVEASNGTIHVIDDVMVPPTIPQAVAGTPDLSTLLTAVGASSTNTQEALASGPITVFAPVNAAFDGIDLGSLDQATVDAILTYHVVGAQVLSGELSDGQVVTTAGGGTFTVQIAGEDVTLTDAMGNVINVIATDIRLLNGTVHLIDGVLMPGS